MQTYIYDIYSARGTERVKCETLYKPEWQVRQELEENYRKMTNVLGSVITVLVNKV